MQRKTSLDTLYAQFVSLFNDLIERRPCYRKSGLQVIPKGPFATVSMARSFGDASFYDVVEEYEIQNPGVDDPTIGQVVRGQTNLDVKFELFRMLRTTPGGMRTAYSDAVRFANALKLPRREQDIWRYCGFCGPLVARETSEMFGADVETRAEVSFTIYANLSEDLTDSRKQNEYEIDSVDLTIVEQDRPDGAETITVTAPSQ